MATCKLIVSTLARPAVGLAKRGCRFTGSTTEISGKRKQRIVVAVGGDALIRRGDRLTIENQLKAARNDAAPVIKKLLEENEVVVTHGNGPQVGELALERSAATFDVLGAETQGQIGYIFSQALAGLDVTAVAILTQVVVDPADPAFLDPTKFVGPVYGAKEAQALSDSLWWTMKPDGEYFRRVVASPTPQVILQLDAVRALLAVQTPLGPLPIVCGGGGVPVTRMGNAFKIASGAYEGLEAVIDKDRCGALLASDLLADGFLLLADQGGIWENFGKPSAREMKIVSTAYLRETGIKFPVSMSAKIEAALSFVEKSADPHAWAAIGNLQDAQDIVVNQKGTLIKKHLDVGVLWYDSPGESAPKPSRVPRFP